jgi:hypothetical protein
MRERQLILDSASRDACSFVNGPEIGTARVNIRSGLENILKYISINVMTQATVNTNIVGWSKPSLSDGNNATRKAIATTMKAAAPQVRSLRCFRKTAIKSSLSEGVTL